MAIGAGQSCLSQAVFLLQRPWCRPAQCSRQDIKVN